MSVFAATPGATSAETSGATAANALSDENCSERLTRIADETANTDFTRLNAADLRDQRLTLFERRLRLREETSHFTTEQAARCATPLRRAFTSLRTQEEMVGEALVRKGALPSNLGKAPSAFDPRWTATNPKFRNWRFKPGDIIIDRGTRPFSSLISRMSDEANVYSHLILIGQDKRGRLYAVETGGETDAHTTPLKEWLRLGSNEDRDGARYALYRYHDENVARQAARFAYHQVKTRENAGDPIRYDFHLRSDDSSEFSCTELASWAYGKASRGAVKLPAVPTTLNKFRGSDLKILDRMEIFVRKWFAPGDMDIDPRFELVAEFRDYSKLRAARRADAISDALLLWMTQRKYQLADDPALWAVANTAVALRQAVPLLPFSDRTPPGMIEVVLKSESLSSALEAELKKVDDAYTAKTGVGMNPAQLGSELEKIRLRDCRSYFRSEPNLFHSSFAPSNGRCD